ncbi:MAG: bifunctional phosphopantothenoylcysteine decarboxylase/phosphopantothenate--cysteine ligase CoaBC, partial [Caldimonas sp.]
SGDQACGEIGDGRMLEPDELLADLVAQFQPKLLQGRSVLITAGPTFEPIDPVRGLTNRSSGKMGFALARAAAEAGAAVTLVAGPVHLPTPRGVRRIDVGSAQQMFDAVLPEAPLHDVFIATAAVADWRPIARAEQKIKKGRGNGAPAFELAENPDILASVAAAAASTKPARPFCVGFAAESEDLIRHARDKLERKRVPLIVANLGPATFGQDHNRVTLVDAAGERELASADKLTLARRLVAEIAPRLPPRAH